MPSFNSEASNNPKEQVRLFLRLARRHMAVDPARALDYNARAIALAERYNLKSLLADAYLARAENLFLKGELKGAATDLGVAELYLERLEEAGLQTKACQLRGSLAYRVGQFKAAAEAYEAALGVQAGRLTPAAARVHANLGLVYWNLYRYAEAIAHFGTALRFFEKGDYPEEQAVTLQNVGQLLLTLGLHSTAKPFFDAALRISERLDMPAMKAASLRNLAQVYVAFGEYQRAADQLHKAAEAYPNAEDALAIAALHQAWGHLYAQRGGQEDVSIALEGYRSAVAAYTTLGNYPEAVACHFALIELLSAQGALELATEHLTEAGILLRRAPNPVARHRLHKLFSEVLTKSGAQTAAAAEAAKADKFAGQLPAPPEQRTQLELVAAAKRLLDQLSEPASPSLVPVRQRA